MVTAMGFDVLRARAVGGAMLGAFERLVGHGGPPGATHEGLYLQDFDLKGAICCTAEEAMLLCESVGRRRPRWAVEIGSYVGWSAAHILAGFEGVRLVCMDPMVEAKDGEATVDRFWENLGRAGLAERVQLVLEESPGWLARYAPAGGWDWAFVDGNHVDGQPLRDVRGLAPLLSEDAVVWLHDTWMPDVRRAADWLELQGWQSRVHDTPGRLMELWRGDE